MEKKSSLTHKDLWNNIFQFLEMRDYLAFEICNRNFKNVLNNYYNLKTNKITHSPFQKNSKKLFFSVYRSSHVVFEVKDEFNSLAENESFNNTIETSKETTKSKNDNSKKTSIELTPNIHATTKNNLNSQG